MKLIENTFLRFTTSDGQKREENGRTDGIIRVEGFYSFIGTDKKLYRVEYTADENGFHPKTFQSDVDEDKTAFEVSDRISESAIRTLLGR